MVLIAPFGSVRPDYLFYVLPLIFLMAAYACEKTRQALQGRFAVTHILTVTAIVSMMPGFVSYYSERSSLHVRDVLAYVENAYRPGDKIISFFPIKYYTKGTYRQEPSFASPYYNDFPWRETLDDLKSDGHRMWIILPIGRASLASGLEGWLRENARLVWRKKATTFNYTVKGHQLFLFDGTNDEVVTGRAPTEN